MSTQAQVTANRANAQLSTGPSSAAGKAKASLNAVKTGLTGRTVVLPTEDVAVYQKHVALFVAKHEPATDEEHYLVQNIADTEWRLLRIHSLEAGFYAIGRVELADSFSEQSDPATRESMLQALIARAYRQDFNNLARQESRLRKQRTEDLAALKVLQDDRKYLYYEALGKAMHALTGAKMNRTPFDASQFGFDFTTEFLEERWQVYTRGKVAGVEQYERSKKINANLNKS